MSCVIVNLKFMPPFHWDIFSSRKWNTVIIRFREFIAYLHLITGILSWNCSTGCTWINEPQAKMLNDNLMPTLWLAETDVSVTLHVLLFANAFIDFYNWGTRETLKLFFVLNPNNSAINSEQMLKLEIWMELEILTKIYRVIKKICTISWRMSDLKNNEVYGQG